MMRVYANGFWGGFLEKTDGCHVGFFEELFTIAFGVPVTSCTDATKCDILLECVNDTSRTMIHVKHWKHSVLFCGEGWGFPLPPHVDEYSVVMGNKEGGKRFVPCPLFLVYEYCKPFEYHHPRSTVPMGDICSVLSAGKNCRRVEVLRHLSQKFAVAMAGRLFNNVGFTVPGAYHEQPIIDFYKGFKVATAFENAEMDYYITEKLVNPLRAGVVPLYLGSPIVTEYVHEQRLVRADDERELEKVLQSPEYFLEKVSGPCYKKTTEQWMREIGEKFQA